MEKKPAMKRSEMERKVSQSYYVIKNDLIKLRKDIKQVYSSARKEAKKQIEAKLNKSKKD